MAFRESVRLSGIVVASLLLLLGNQAHAAVGVTAGEASVDPTGAANYRIPLIVPPGRAGVQPELALLYHSRAGNGQLGVGWSLEGLSAVTRCPAALEPDGYTDSVRLQPTDRFCLDGQKLVALGGTYGASGVEYRTEIESFRKVVSSGSAGNGPASFQVKTNAGLIIDYGTNGNSRILAQGSSTVLVWAVRRIADRNGNAIEFEYGRGDDGDEYWISEIQYAGQFPVSIGFTYDSGRPDKVEGWIAGSRSRLSRRLTAIETRHGANLVRRYDLAYEFGTKSGRSLLKSVTECDAGNECLPPTTFRWQMGTDEPIIKSLPFSHEMGGLRFLDIEGNGNADMLYVRNESWRLRRGPAYDNEQNLGACQNCVDSIYAIPFSYGNDGQERTVLLRSQATDTFITRSIASGGFTPAQNTNIPTHVDSFPAYRHALITDINGNGRADLIVPTPSAIRVYAGLPSGAFNSMPQIHAAPAGMRSMGGPVTEGGRFLHPFPFDGRNGLLTYTCEEPQPPDPPDIFPPPEPQECTGALVWLVLENGQFVHRTLTESHLVARHFRFADVNGDGLPDMLYSPQHGNTPWQLLLNDGVRLIETGATIPHGLAGHMHLADLHGDGISTIVVPYEAAHGESLRYYRWQDGALAEAVNLEEPMGVGNSTHLFYLDMNGTGLPDRLNKGLGSGNWVIRQSAPVMNDLLVRATIGADQLDRASRFFYVPLADTNFYTRGPHYDINDYRSFAGPIHVVAHVAEDAGVEAENAQVFTSYHYARGRLHKRGRGFSGFEEVAALNVNAKTYTINRHRTDFPFTGMVRETEQHVVGTASIEVPTLPAALPAPPTTHLAEVCDLVSDPFVYGGEQCSGTAHPVQPGTSFIGPPEFANRKLVASTTHSFSAGPVAGAPAGTSTYPRVTETVAREHDLDSGAVYRRTTTAYQYGDGFGNPTSIVVTTDDGSGGDAHSVATASSYSNNAADWCLGRVTSTTVTHAAPNAPSIQRQSEFSYENCQLKSETISAGALSLVTSYQFDSFGNRTATTVAGGSAGSRVTERAYDRGTFVRLTRNALGHTEQRIWDGAHGALLSQTGPNGLTTKWTYDGFGRRTGELRANGDTIAWQREWCSTNTCASPTAMYRAITRESHVNVTANPNPYPNASSITEHDLHGREVASATRDLHGNWVYEYVEYDAIGQVSRRSLPALAGASVYWADFRYDGLGRVTRERQPRSGGYDVTRYAYAGLATTITAHDQDPSLRRRAQRTVNVMDRLVQFVDMDAPGGSLATTYLYDAAGNTRQTVDAGGEATVIAYDARGFQSGMTAPEMGSWSYVHNAFGELEEQTDAAGNKVIQQYDALGRLVERVDLHASGNTETTWVYDISHGAGIGKLAYVSATGVDPYWEGYAYDRLGQRTDTFTIIGGQDVFWTSTDYDEHGRVAMIQYPDIVLESAPGGAPSAPGSITASTVNPDDGVFTLTWGSVTGGPSLRYYVQQERVSTPGNWVPAYYGDSTTVDIVGLQDSELADSDYRYRVQACVREDCSAWTTMTGSVTVHYRPSDPGLPEPVAQAVATNESVDVIWAPSIGPVVKSYRLQRNFRPFGGSWQGWQTVAAGADPDDSSYPGFTPGAEGEWQFRVRANRPGVGNSGNVSGSILKVLDVPGTPSQFDADPNPNPDGAFTVSWHPPQQGSELSYRLQQRNAGEEWPGEDEGFVETGTSRLFHGVADGSYQYRVRAENDAGHGPWSTTLTVDVKVPPPPPPQPDATPNPSYSGNFTVKWDSVGASGYRLEELAPGGEWEVVPTTHIQKEITVQSAGTYAYRVSACNELNLCGTPSPTRTVLVTEPDTPENLSWSDDGSSQCTIQWKPSEGTVYYELWAKTAAGSVMGTEQTASSPHHFPNDAQCFLYYHVRACSGIGCSAWTGEDNGPPSTPSQVAITPNPSGTGGFTVKWSPGLETPAAGYVITERYMPPGGGWQDMPPVTVPPVPEALQRSGAEDGDYEFSIQAFNDSGSSGISAAATVTVMKPPDRPSSITVPTATVTDGDIAVSWGPSNGSLARYELYESGLQGVVGNLVYSGLDISHTRKDRLNGTYWYQVRACNSLDICSNYRQASTGVSVSLPPGPPTGLGVPGVNYSGSYAAEWDSTATATSYRLERRQVGTGGWSEVHNGSATSKALSVSQVGTYEHRVRACNASGCGAYSDIASLVVTTPDTPENLSWSDSGANQCTIQWNPSVGTVHYELWAKTAAGSFMQHPQTTSTTHHFPGDAQCFAYYHVRACSGIGCSAWTGEDNGPPSTPSQIAITPNPSTTGGFTVKWSPGLATPAAGYVITERYKPPGGAWQDLPPVTVPRVPETLQRSGAEDGDYEFRIQAYNASGSSGTSAAATVTVMKPPGAPSSITVPSTTSTNGSISVSWGTASGSVSSYRLYEAANSSFSGQTQVYNSSGTSTTLTGRGDGTYYYRVRACNSSCSGYRTASSGVTVLRPPGTPGTVSAGPNPSTNGSFTISWGASSGAVSGYRLQESFNGGSWTTLSSTISGTSYNRSGRPDGSYSYRVRAQNSSGNSSYRTMSGTVTVLRPPGTPGTMSASPSQSTNGSYSVSWGAASGSVSTYRLQQRSKPVYSGSWSGWSTVATVSGSTTSRSFSGMADRLYEYRVRAQNASGNSSYRTIGSAVRVLRSPGGTGTASVTPNPTTNPYTVSWPAASGTIKHYQVQHSINSTTNWTTIATQGSRQLSQSQPAGTTHWYRIRACNDTACGGWSPNLGVWVGLGGGNPISDPDAPMGEPEPGGEQ